MGSQFKVAVHRNYDNLHLKLMGDFDGSSEFELLNILKKYCKGADRVFIHTNCLNRIDTLECHRFHHYLRTMKEQAVNIVFTGDHAQEITPQ